MLGVIVEGIRMSAKRLVGVWGRKNKNFNRLHRWLRNICSLCPATSNTATFKRSLWAGVTLGATLVFQAGYALAADSVEQLRASGARVVADPGTGITRFIGFDAQTEAVRSALAAQPENAALQLMPAEAAAATHLSNYAGLFGLRDAASETQAIKHLVRDDGRTMTRYQQHYQGVPVIAGELIVNQTAQRQLTSIGGKISPDIKLDTTPVITGEQAQSIALQAMVKWYQLPENEFVITKPQLSIYDSRLLSPHTDPIALVWRMDIRTQSLQPINEFMAIDAKTGVITLHFNQVPHAKNRMTYDGNNTTALPGTLLCSEANPSCSGAIQDAVYAHIYAGKTYDFYWSKFGRDGIDGAGMTMISTVRHCSKPADCPMQNAYWNGNQMAYGQSFSIGEDVVAHELTHGVTQRESNLYYYYQSGAINESLSDVFGELAQQSDPSGTVTPATKWLLGEDLPGGAGRSMSDPTLYKDPDKMTSSLYDFDPNFYDNGGVHYNSGIGNKAAYLMTDGGTFNGRTVVGLGLTKAAKIYYEVQTNLLTSGSDYLDLYNALYQACQNLVGTAGIVATDCQQVRNATDAVEMNLPPVAGFNPEASVCPAGQAANNVFFDGIEAGGTNWSLSGTSGKWFLGNSFAKSGTGNLIGRGHGNTTPVFNIDASVQLANPIVIPANASLRFDHAFDFEGGASQYYDGGLVEYSVAGGPWMQLTSFADGQGYSGVLSASNVLAGKQAFSGVSHGYVSTRFNLGSLAGQSVRFRWRLGTDDQVESMGWWIDNVRVYTCAGASGTLPSAPAIGVATPGNGSARVAFTPGAIGSGTLVNYTAMCGAITATGTSSPITVSGLTNGTAYTCKVRTTSTVGTGSWSAVSNSVTPSASVTTTGSLTTTFAGGTSLHGNMFDVKALNGSLTINRFNLNLVATAGTVVPVRVYYKTGSYVGYEATPSAWALLGTYSVTSAGYGSPSSMPVGNLLLTSGQTYGVYLTTTDGSSFGYTTGANTYANADIQATLGAGIAYPFAATYTPRTWNGTIYYSRAAGTLPAAPAIGVATAGNGSARVAFTPGAIGSGTLLSYTAMCGSVSATGTSSPVTVTGLTNGTAYTCKVRTTSSVGIGPWSALSNSVTPLSGGATPMIEAGYGHTCALTSGGAVKCWGYNFSGQLGDGSATNRLTPVAVSGLTSGMVAISAGDTHTCALTSGGAVKCWGTNSYGQLGDGSTTWRQTPVNVVGLASGVVALAAGGAHTCALTSGGAVKCWGYNIAGQLGDGTSTNRLTPVAVSGLTSGAVAISAGRNHTCALTSGGAAKCWGANSNGQLGDGSGTQRLTPVNVTGLAGGVNALAAGYDHTCALTSGGAAKCWGWNFGGQLGDGSATDRLTPVGVTGLAGGVSAIAAGYQHTCALTSGGAAKCWGNNVYGQLGDGSTTDRLTPVNVTGLAGGVSALAAGADHTCALTSGGAAKCWGNNASGELGDGSTTDRLTPVNVVGLSTGLPTPSCSAITPATASVTLGSPSPLLAATCTNSPTSYVWKVGAATLSCSLATCTIPAASLPAAGTYNVTVRANNAAGAGTQAASATITVTAATGAPISWTPRISNTAAKLNRVIFAGGQFVAVGQTGAIVTSPDGVSWTPRNSGTAADIGMLAYGNGYYVAISSMGVLKSSNGINWTFYSWGVTPPSSTISSITYGNGVFVMVGYGPSKIYRSTDGLSWSDSGNGGYFGGYLYGGSGWHGVTFANGMFVTVGDVGHISTSSDGATWTLRQQAGDDLLGVTYGSAGFLAAGPWHTVQTSPNGVAWSLIHKTPSDSGSFYLHTFGAGYYILTGYWGDSYVTRDGVNFSDAGLPPGGNQSTIWNSVAYGNGTFAAVGNGGQVVSGRF